MQCPKIQFFRVEECTFSQIGQQPPEQGGLYYRVFTIRDAFGGRPNEIHLLADDPDKLIMSSGEPPASA